MALTTFNYDMAIIQKLDDEPNDVGGLSAAQLKAKFDEGGEEIKKFLNENLIPELEDDFSDERDYVDKTFALKTDLDGLVIGVSPDLKATEQVLAAM